MVNKPNIKKAYTILELLIVMGIVSVTVALSIYGMLQFRRLAEADQAVTDIVSSIKETKNRAKNNTIDTKNNLDLSILVKNNFGYLLKFDTDQVTRYTCTKLRTATWNAISTTQCITNKEELKKSSFSNIGFESATPGCDGFLLENLTEKISITNVNVINAGITACTINVILKDDSNAVTKIFRRISVNTITGNITVN
jgi:type II secretory pathway pseudopilin PulG